jgi:hypothetical protein
VLPRISAFARRVSSALSRKNAQHFGHPVNIRSVNNSIAKPKLPDKLSRISRLWKDFGYDFCDLRIVEKINQVAKSAIDGTAKRAERLPIATRLDGLHNASLFCTTGVRW